MILTPLQIGAQNLLFRCAKLSSGDSVLVILEDPELGWYKRDIAEVIIDEALALGIQTRLMTVSGPTNEVKDDLLIEMENYDCTIFFARIGDQDRFEANSFKSKRVMSYVRNARALASSFGTASYIALQELKNNINNLLSSSEEIHIRCPKGTDIRSRNPGYKSELINDVRILRFPVVVPAPVGASLTSGKVVLDNYLTPTGSKVYQPGSLPMSSPIAFYVNNGQIVNFEGDAQLIEDIKTHYRTVAGQFNITWDAVHSWHAGIHPGTSYSYDPAVNPDRWSNSLFASPKFLHFHTCGNYAPGEICWMVENPTVSIAGQALWDNGVLRPELFESTDACLKKWPDLYTLFG
ncbi:MAG: hypothetical protein VYE27_09095 [Pseudomonadota bacterium]|nr:hypothetical protein [Pseudomonadota bacterium]